MEKLRLREGWDQLGSHEISVMVKGSIHPHNVLVPGVQGRVLGCIVGLTLHPWGASSAPSLPGWVSRGLLLPPILPTMEGEHEAITDPVPQCWEAKGDWQGTGVHPGGHPHMCLQAAGEEEDAVGMEMCCRVSSHPVPRDPVYTQTFALLKSQPRPPRCLGTASPR